MLNLDIQKADLWKRVAAWILDGILLCVLAVGCIWGLSVLMDYDSYVQTVEDSYTKYETQFGVDFDITMEQFEALTQADKDRYQAANDALQKDEQALYAYQMAVSLSLVVVTFGILIAVMLLEFVLPLLLGSGATVGKKVFGLGLVRPDCIKINRMQLFVRVLIGKYTIETMIPVFLVLMMMWNMMDITGTFVICALGIAQVVIFFVTRNRYQIHDLLAGTVVVDIQSQKVFADMDERIEYQKKIAAEKAANQIY